MAKVKKCRVCKEPFEPQRPLQSVCGFDCAKVLGKDKSAKADKEHVKRQRAELKAAKLAIKKKLLGSSRPNCGK